MTTLLILALNQAHQKKPEEPIQLSTVTIPYTYIGAYPSEPSHVVITLKTEEMAKRYFQKKEVNWLDFKRDRESIKIAIKSRSQKARTVNDILKVLSADFGKRNVLRKRQIVFTQFSHSN